MRVVLTIVGMDKVGIIANASRICAESNVNILSINQNIMDGFFNMVLIGDLAGATVDLAALKAKFDVMAAEQALEIHVQSEEIFKAMHRI